MAAKKTSGKPGWGKVKSHISQFDHAGLVELIHDLYEASNENRVFLHARFDLGEDTLEPYKKSLERWLSPDVFRPNQDVSVSKALKAISDYKKAVGRPEGVAELMVFYCEQGADLIGRLNELPTGLPRVLLATGKLIGEGFDHPPLDTLVLAMPISWRGTLQQYAGRLHRELANKQDMRIFDYLDEGHPSLLRMWKKRQQGYRAMGYTIKESPQK